MSFLAFTWHIQHIWAIFITSSRTIVFGLDSRSWFLYRS